MTIKKNIWADIQDGVTQGLAAAELVNDNKRAVNEVIDVVNDLGTASTRNVATNAQAIAGTAGVLPDAAGVKAHVDSRVTQSTTDTTAGRLLKVGDYGLGRFDNAPFIGVELNPDDYRVGGTYVGSFNIYGGIESGFLAVHAGSSADVCAQEFIGWDLGNKYFRVRKEGVWHPWKKLYHTGNIVGTVSQSGGVPTGAIIQRGSNANGEFVRYADGTQICTTIGDFTDASVGTQLIIAKPHPAPFNTVSSVQYSAYSQIGTGSQNSVGLVYINGVYTSGTTTTVLSVGCYTYREALLEPVRFYFTTMGRWY